MALVDKIVQALEALGGVAKYSELYSYLEKNAIAPLPKKWKASVRARIEENSSDSQAFKGRQDLFYAVNGLGNGVWGLRSNLLDNLVAIDIEEPANNKFTIREGGGIPNRVPTTTTRIIRDTLMTRQLKMIYGYKCQICEKAVLLPGRLYAEAHHLRPLGGTHKGTDEVGNILVVCPNHHVEFDFAAIAIDPVELTIVHTDSSYPFLGKTVGFHSLHKINEVNLVYHMAMYLSGIS